jgi:hypothetical protein
MAKHKAKNKYDLLCSSLRLYSSTIAKIVYTFPSKLFIKKELFVKEEGWSKIPYYHLSNWEPVNEFYDKYYTNDFKASKSEKYKKARSGIRKPDRTERQQLLHKRLMTK